MVRKSKNLKRRRAKTKAGKRANTKRWKEEACRIGVKRT